MQGNFSGTFYEFFAGGGMVRAGLGKNWQCMFANDFDLKKSAIYRKNWGDNELQACDIRVLKGNDLPNSPKLVWASFPCQDLSLAGGGAGLKGERSGTFWPFWSLMKDLISNKRAPRLIVLENVCGTLSSHKGKDFVAICQAFEQAGYSFGAVVVDAALFVPQSRPRLFIIGVHQDQSVPPSLTMDEPSPLWHTKTLLKAYNKLPEQSKSRWVWWDIPRPKERDVQLVDIIEENPVSVEWDSHEKTQQLLSMMSDVNLAKVEQAKLSGIHTVGSIYKRTRHDKYGRKVQRAEVRFDGLAGCLRTPAGGSSRQLIIVIDRDNVRSRLISSRETARLMGLSDNYILPEKYNEAYHLTGDGVAVPVVKHLAKNIFEPLILNSKLNASLVAA